MKRLIGILALTGIFIFSCEDSAPEDEVEGCIEVRMIGNICGNAVLQVLNPDLHDIETEDWTERGVTYENVIYSLLPCEVDDSLLETGALFHIGTLNEPAPQDGLCARCAATFANPPSVFYHLEILENCGN